MFTPPRCPNPVCPAHSIEKLGKDKKFFQRRGSYQPKCRARPVPRFQCLVCKKGFSRQTFREDYRDHKPHLNPKLIELLAQGLGLRQTARILPLSRRCAEMKARKISRHLRGFNRNMLDQFPSGCSFQLDEMETFEEERTALPLTVPVFLEQESMFVVDARSAPIRPSGRMSKSRMLRIWRQERRKGRRISGSRKCVGRVLRTGSKYCKKLPKVRVDSDEKSTYPGLLRKAFGPGFEHRTTSSKRPRDTRNRLFPINHMNAMARYLTGRLRRRSWLASKQRRFLDLQCELFKAYMNFVRPRFNIDKKTPAMVLGFTHTMFKLSDLVSWRQDWGWFSPHPTVGHRTVRDERARDRELGRASFQVPVEKRGYAD